MDFGHGDRVQFDYSRFTEKSDTLGPIPGDGHENTLFAVDENNVVTLLGVVSGSLHALDFMIV